MSLTILSPGLLTTIQDAGRYGWQQYGFSPGGALDVDAMATANLLAAGNDPGEAVLEMTLLGAEMRFEKETIVALAGGLCQPRRNGESVPMYAALAMRAGDTLAVGPVVDGCRVYAAFAGGLQVPTVMGSKSTQIKYGLGGLEGRALKTGDTLSLLPPRHDLRKYEGRTLPAPSRRPGTKTLRAVLGPQAASSFDKAGIETFLREEYEVTATSDRMGCRLEGKPIPLRAGADIVSDAIALGSVQVPSGGKPIVLLSDRQTVGGYAKIAAVISVDIPVIAQCRPGDRVRFEAVSVLHAQRLYRRWQKHLAALQKRFL